MHHMMLYESKIEMKKSSIFIMFVRNLQLEFILINFGKTKPHKSKTENFDISHVLCHILKRSLP